MLPGIVGTIRATAALKLLLGIGEPLIGQLLLIDALGPRFRTMRLERDPACPACGTREIRELIDSDEFCGARSNGSLASADTTIRESLPQISRHEWRVVMRST